MNIKIGMLIDRKGALKLLIFELINLIQPIFR